MSEIRRNTIDWRYTPKHDSRWTTYGNYRLILWAWMLNEISMVQSATSICHEGFYIHGILHIVSTIIIGIPLVYSEICLAQYTNNDIISMWNFFPLLRPVGYGTIYLVFLKTMYTMAITCWYLQYTFYAAMDPPPWYSCEDYNSSKCMVKWQNLSSFQHCLEAQMLFNEDCGIKTASYLFFEKNIGSKNTMNSIYCAFSFETMIASVTISIVLFVLSFRKEKFFQISAKLLAVYVCAAILSLLCVSLSTSGAWYATKISIDWNIYDFNKCYKSIVRGFLSVGTGFGVIGFLSHDVPFRSPATMTSITAPLCSILITVLFALVGFSGIKTMSYYHGEEENVIEVGVSRFFQPFASMSEILSYFDQTPLWGFMWFSSIVFCLFINLWILQIFLLHLVNTHVGFIRCRSSFSNAALICLMCILSWPLCCSDVASAFADIIEIIQIINSLLFSISLYWIYGFHNHNVDIIFMIGIKASYYWKITWILNPIFISSILYTKYVSVEIKEEESSYIKFSSIRYNWFLVYILIAVYALIVFIGILIEIVKYFRKSSIRLIFSPTENWGPKDTVLFKSRKMFVSEIMTREFLYRQVKINSYTKRENFVKEDSIQNESA